jgi:hypothetical protein
MEFLLHRRRGRFKKKKMPPHVGIRFFKIPHHFFFFICIEYHKKKSEKLKIKILPGCFTWGKALGMKCC